ncbi:hypothetical protein [Brevundimonas sp.]|uniref:hypothetical protein n=1 Tax=Brevundimonas sp. TaxID=1871086 RepID=UPI002AB8D4CA|nr:hypothetical protein [Brevundimonas sp.]MDZ4362855.1 hypothetical protein [Brevundimonas sp.]
MTATVAACILLLPGEAATVWRERLEAAAGEDWSVLPYAGQPLSAIAHGTILLVSDIAHARHLEPARWIVVALAPGEAARAAAVAYDLPTEQGLWVVSRLLAEASTLSDALWITDQTVGAIEIVPGLRVPAAEHLPEATDASAARTALSLFAGGPPRHGASAQWARDLFRHTSTSDVVQGVPERLDITGRGRILVFGPYVSLPPGDWRIRLRFWMDTSAAKASWRLEWGDQARFATHAFRPGRAGRFEVEISHRWEAAAPSELRLALDVPAVDGVLGFEGVRVDRVG